MTYEEALIILEKQRKCCERSVGECHIGACLTCEFFTDEKLTIKAINVAEEALEKQIKKKPYPYYDGYHDGLPAWEYKCPNCGREVDDTDHHCECGQAIDWNEDNE